MLRPCVGTRRIRRPLLMTMSRRFCCGRMPAPKCTTIGRRRRRGAAGPATTGRCHKIGNGGKVSSAMSLIMIYICRHASGQAHHHQRQQQQQHPRRQTKKFLEHRGPPTLYVTRPAGAQAAATAVGEAGDNNRQPQIHIRHNNHHSQQQQQMRSSQNVNTEQRHKFQV